MSMQSQFKSKILLETIEPLPVIKDEPEVMETYMDDILDPLHEDEKICPDIKDEIDIKFHVIPEDFIKSEPIPNNLLESEHFESVETQIFVQTENTPSIKRKIENLIDTEGNSHGNLSVEETLESTHKKRKAKMEKCRLEYHCNKCKYKTFWLSHLKSHKIIHLKPEEIVYFYHCYHCSYKCNNKSNLKRHIFNHFKNEEVPFHCYICDFMTSKSYLIIEHLKKHPEHCSKWEEIDYKNRLETYSKKKLRYSCKKCTFRTYYAAKFKLHELTHDAERDDQYLKYHCDQCEYKTFRLPDFNRHKLIHLKPERIPYFYCYYCSYKCIQKNCLKIHIFRHFKNEEVPFHCYICDFVTLKRNFIVEHFKEHPEHGSKCDETEYKNQLNTYTKKQKSLYNCKKCMFRTCHYENLKKHEVMHLKPEEISYFYCHHCSYKSKRKCNLKIHISRHFNREEVLFRCYICEFVTLKRDLIIEHLKKQTEHHKYEETEYQLQTYTKKQQRTFSCKKCTYRTYNCENLNLHKLSHEADQDDRHLKYRCNKCNYKTFRLQHFKDHGVIHLKPEEIQYFYCYHCFYKSKRKKDLREHILRHFKNEVVKFDCYMCNFMTLKRYLITEHIKNHSKVEIKFEINE